MRRITGPMPDVEEFVRSVSAPLRRRAWSGFMLGFFGRLSIAPENVGMSFRSASMRSGGETDGMPDQFVVFIDQAATALEREGRYWHARDVRLQSTGFVVGPLVRALPITMVAWGLQHSGPLVAIGGALVMLSMDAVLSMLSVRSVQHLRDDLAASYGRMRLPWD